MKSNQVITVSADTVVQVGGRVQISCIEGYRSTKRTINVLHIMFRTTVLLDFSTGKTSACFLMSSGIKCVSERISTVIFFFCETELMLSHV